MSRLAVKKDIWRQTSCIFYGDDGINLLQFCQVMNLHTERETHDPLKSLGDILALQADNRVTS